MVTSIGGYGAESLVEIFVILLIDQTRAPRAVRVFPIKVSTTTLRSWIRKKASIVITALHAWKTSTVHDDKIHAWGYDGINMTSTTS